MRSMFFPVNISNIVYQKNLYTKIEIYSNGHNLALKKLLTLVTHSIIVVFILLVYNYNF